MNLDFTNYSDIQVAQALLATVTEAGQRGLLRKSYLMVGPMMAETAVQLAARKAVGLPALQRRRRADQMRAGTTHPEQMTAGGAQ